VKQNPRAVSKLYGGQDKIRISAFIGYSVRREQRVRTEVAPSSRSAETIHLLLNLLVKKNSSRKGYDRVEEVSTRVYN
jgi:hypothetical protein